jgi:hypothetical protein
MNVRKLYSCLFLLALGFKTYAGRDSIVHFRAGIISNKMLGFYWLNGISAEMNSKKICKGKIDLGLNIYSSSFGSAFFSNAIPVHALEGTIQKRFMTSRKLNTVIGLNLGFAKAFYGPGFDQLRQSSFLLAPEFGLNYVLAKKISTHFCLGYNVFNGSGIKGPGFIYPVCLRFKLLYHL